MLLEICHEVWLPNSRNKISSFAWGWHLFSLIMFSASSVFCDTGCEEDACQGIEKGWNPLLVPGTMLSLILLLRGSPLSTGQQKVSWSGRLQVRVVESSCQSLVHPSGALRVFLCLSGSPGCRHELAGGTKQSIRFAL